MRELQIINREDFEKLYPNIGADEAVGEPKTVECHWVKNGMGVYEFKVYSEK